MKIKSEYRAGGVSYPTLADAKSALQDGGVIVLSNGKNINPDRPDGDIQIARWSSRDGAIWQKIARV